MEAACRKKQQAAADKVNEAQAKRDQAKTKLLAMANQLKTLMERASKVCAVKEGVDCKEWDKRVNSATMKFQAQRSVATEHQRRLAAAVAILNSANAKNCNLMCKQGKSACQIGV